jgi:hypothetical protein
MAALGIARLGDSQMLADAGADLVVTTLDVLVRGETRELASGRHADFTLAHAETAV